MRGNKGFFWFAFDSAHVKYGVWTWPKETKSVYEDSFFSLQIISWSIFVVWTVSCNCSCNCHFSTRLFLLSSSLSDLHDFIKEWRVCSVNGFPSILKTELTLAFIAIFLGNSVRRENGQWAIRLKLCEASTRGIIGSLNNDDDDAEYNA